MKISYNWLQEYFSETLPIPKDLAEAITMHSYEVESIEEKNSDFILDIDILPNRSADSFSHNGVAKELSAVLDLPIKNKESREIQTDEGVTAISVSIKEENLCSRYMARVIEGVSIKESPEWMKQKLASLGQKSINNVVDATNIAMFETGQPLHAFDLNNVADNKIEVRNALAGETIKTLDDQELELDSQTLVIADGQKPLAIAGIKGGKDAGVSENTTTLLLEAANFNSTQIRKTSKKIGIRTESSLRFEHGPSPVLVEKGMDRLIEILLDVAKTDKTKVGQKVDIYPRPKQESKTIISLEKVNRVLGVTLSPDDVRVILKRLGFLFNEGAGVFTVSLPLERLDLIGTGGDNLPRSEYLIEEIGRIYGYENIEETMPTEKMTPPVKNQKYYHTEMIRNWLLGLGLTEAYNYSLTKEGAVALKNFMSEDRSFLRANLSGEFMSAIESNLRFFDEVKMFEFGTVFLKDEAYKIKEETHLAFGVSYRQGKKQSQAIFGELKGYLEVLLKGLNVSFYITDEREDYEILVANDVIGHIDPEGFVEINFDQLIVHSRFGQTVFEPINKFPSVDRDVSLFVTPHTKVRDVEEIIREFAGPWLKEISLFDIFEKADKKSLAFRLIFQSEDRTLTDEEVNDYMNKVYKTLDETPDWQIR